MPVLALLFLVVPLLELFVIIQVGQWIGVLNTIGLLIVMSVVGAWLMKREGLATLRRFQRKLSTGQLPENELVDGFLILFGGALMLTPGFLSDVLGTALLLPPVRAMIRPVIKRQVSRRVVIGSTGTVRRNDVIDL